MSNGSVLVGMILGFIALIVGLSLLSTTSDTISSMTEFLDVDNESFTAQNETAVSLAQANITGLVVRNSTSATALTSGTDYTADVAAGTVTMNATYASGGLNASTETWYADYSYQPENWVASSPSRSLILLVRIFFALAILLGAMRFVDWKGLGLKK